MLKLTQIPAVYPSQSRTSGPVAPTTQYATNKTSGQLNTDQVHFGASDLDMPFRQRAGIPYTGTTAQPISPNNCQVCSAKNLLVYYGYSPKTVDSCLQNLLTIEATDPRNELKFSPQLPIGDAIDLNPHFVEQCLTNLHGGLNMIIDPCTIKDISKIRKAIDKGLPLIVRAKYREDTHTLAASGPNQGHNLDDEHAYTVIPDRSNNQQWKVLDSMKERPTVLSTEQLKQNLSTMTSLLSTYCIVRKGPDKNRVEAYAAEPSTVVQPESKPVAPDIPSTETDPKSAAPSTQSNKTDSAPATSSTQSVKTEPASTTPSTPPGKVEQPDKQDSNAKKGLLTRMKGWFKRQWQKVVNAFKRFGRWLKKPFSSSK